MTYIQKMKLFFDNLSLKYKLIAILFFNGFLILSTAFAGLQLSSRAYNEQLFRAVAGNLSFSSQTISNTLKDIETMSSVAISSTNIQDSMTSIALSEDSRSWSNANRILNLSISTYQQAYKKNGVSCILLYNRAFKNVTDFSILNKTNPQALNRALERTIQKEGAVSWTIDYDENLTILGRSVRRVSNLDLAHLGDLLIFVDMNRIVSNTNQAVTTYTDSHYILYDKQQKQLLYTSPNLSRSMAEAFLPYSDEAPYHIVRVDGHSYFVTASKLPYYEWTYINLIPYDQIAASLRTTRFLIAAILVVGVLLSVFLATYMTRHILQDFHLLIRKMELFSNGLEVPETENEYSSRHDEISRLHRHFGTMTLRIRDLIQKNYVNEILAQDAKLKALESQINPHFLYNTLETINWRAKALKDIPISSMVESLGTLLRATLSNRKKLVSLNEELELVKCYMTIQEIRYEERLQFRIFCDFTLENALIPPMTIQPLLENAVRYGLEEMTETCLIEVHVLHQNNILHLEVSNDGSAFEDNLLEQLLDGSKNAHGFGIGLVNIHQRIQMLFGTQYGLSFINRSNRAVAIVSIPYTTEGDCLC